MPAKKKLDTPPGTTISAGGRYLRITKGKNRDKYVHRVEAEKRLGRNLATDEVVDHVDPKSKLDPKAKTRVISRSENSKKDGGLRTGTVAGKRKK